MLPAFIVTKSAGIVVSQRHHAYARSLESYLLFWPRGGGQAPAVFMWQSQQHAPRYDVLAKSERTIDASGSLSLGKPLRYADEHAELGWYGKDSPSPRPSPSRERVQNAEPSESGAAPVPSPGETFE